jgi:hypothetical protein
VTSLFVAARSVNSASSASRPISSDTGSGRLVRRWVNSAAGSAGARASGSLEGRRLISPVNWYPRPVTVRISARSAPKALRSAAISAASRLSSTILPGQTRSSSSSLLTTEPEPSISAISTSKARPPSLIGRPAARNSRRSGKMLKWPNWMIAGGSDRRTMEAIVNHIRRENHRLLRNRSRERGIPAAGSA